MTAETLRAWVRRAEVDEGKRPGLTTDERQRPKDPETEKNRELKRSNASSKVAVFFATELDGRPNK
jgi:transposase